MSIVDIYTRVNKKWMNYSNDNSLEKTFKLTFWWTLRDTSGSENTRKKTKWNIDNAKIAYAEDVEKKYEKIKNYVSDNIYKILSRKNLNFNKDYFLWLENNWQRILYAIEVFLWLKKEDIINMNKQWPWARVIANYLEKRLSIYIKNYDLKLPIYPKYIQAILNEEK